MQSSYSSGDFQMPITLSKICYDTRSIVHVEALEHTLRLRLVSGLVDKKCFFSYEIACPLQYAYTIEHPSQANCGWAGGRGGGR